jgi:hypothetical protein
LAQDSESSQQLAWSILPNLFSFWIMGCHSSKSVAATEPKTLLTSPPIVPDKVESRSLAQYVADVSSASDAEVRAALQGLSVAEQTRLGDILSNMDSATREACAPAETQAGSLEALKAYVADASTASESEVTAALHGLSSAERRKLMDALNTLPVMEAELPASGVGMVVVAEVADAPAESGVALAETVADTMEPIVVTSTPSLAVGTANSSHAKSWISCCVAPTDATIEFVP